MSMSFEQRAPPLTDVAHDLFRRYQNEPSVDRIRAVDEHVLALARQTMVLGDAVNLEQTQQVALVAKEVFLPAYATYKQEEHEILSRTYMQNPVSFVGKVVAGLTLVEAVLTRGAVLRPPAMAETLLLNAVVSGGAQWVMRQIGNYQLSAARERLFEKVRSANDRLSRHQTLDTLTEVDYDKEVAREQAAAVLEHYSSPDRFWTDYREIFTADPHTRDAAAYLDKPAFSAFLSGHKNGNFNDQQRKARFRELFLAAHEKFSSQDGSYLERHIE